MNKKEPFWKSTKKTLGVIGFFCYWIIQVPAIKNDPSIIISLTPFNMALVLGLLGLKKIGNNIQKEKVSE